jgi:hypothetical protein
MVVIKFWPNNLPFGRESPDIYPTSVKLLANQLVAIRVEAASFRPRFDLHTVEITVFFEVVWFGPLEFTAFVSAID